MAVGEWLTRGTVWLALLLYVAGEGVQSARCDRKRRVWAWRLSALGLATFLVHVACAFHYYHDWSHTAAYTDTARQTEGMIGWNWGGGLYINYAFAIAWAGEVFWRWANSSAYLGRPAWVTWTVRGFFAFMIFNGAVVFAGEIMRWFGLLLCSVLAGCWWRLQQL